MTRDFGETKLLLVETSRCHDVAVPLSESAECELKGKEFPLEYLVA